MPMKFVNPKNDIAFKRIFGDEHHTDILISFLNAVLGLEGERQIQTIELLNPYQAPQIDMFKETILDIRATDQRGITFIVEMQVENLVGLIQRFVFYATKAYSLQIERGDHYPQLNQVILVGILDFTKFEGNSCITHHRILNIETLKQEIKDLEFTFIELPKFTKTEAEIETVLDKWLYFIKYAYQLDAIPPNVNESPLQAAYERANSFAWSRQELELYDYWSVRAQDDRGRIEYAREEGLQEGRQEERYNIARTMLANGMEPSMVMHCTGLSAVELDALQAET